MREILFRGKKMDNGEWVYGTPFQEYSEFWDEWEWKIQTKHPLTNVPYMRLKVNINTICQFTGLTDKNGKRIFEGDIVKDITDGVLREVFYCNESAMFLKKGILRSSLGNPLHLEVIGNIHDNPELLGG